MNICFYRDFSIILSILICVGIISCKNDSEQVKKSKLTEQKEQLERIVDPVLRDSSYAFIPAFVEYMEQAHCMEAYKLIDGCIELHESTCRDDFMAKRPINAKFPYDGTFSWEGLAQLTGFHEYWSGKCGFYDEELDIAVNFYCPNIKAEMLVWLDKIGQDNQLIARFTEMYLKTQTVTADFQQIFILQALSSLDFNNLDHKAFYWTYHLTLSSEYLGNKEFVKLTKNVSKK